MKTNVLIREYKKEIAYFMRRLYKMGLTTTSGGNISARISDNLVAITPSASDKGRMRADEIGLMNLKGEMTGEKFRPSIESKMHLNIYKARSDVKAVVHAHPVTASIFTASTEKINTSLLAESYIILGDIAHVPYFLMGTEALAAAVAEHAKSANCLMMQNHGVVALGGTLLEAFDRLEVLETAAKITALSLTVLKGKTSGLNKKQLAEIDHMIGR